MKRPDVELFACSCGDERKAQWDAHLAEVIGELKTTPDLFLSAVVYGLINYSAEITGMPADQWAAICAGTYDGTFAVRIQCDRLEHGLAAVWRAFTERFPDGHYTPTLDDDDDEEDADDG